MNTRPWNAFRHNFAASDAGGLTETDPRAAEPRGFVSTLWDPQKTLLAAMLAYEDFRSVVLFEGPLGVEPFAGHSPVATTSIARIAEKLSFGKTVVCIALICASPAPRAYPYMVGRANRPAEAVAFFKRDGRSRTLATRRADLVEVKHPRLIRATLVVAAASVIAQWADNLRRHAPGLRVVTVTNSRELKKFEARLAAMDFDVVLLKAGTVTLKCRAEGEVVNPIDLHPSIAIDAYDLGAWMRAEAAHPIKAASRPMTQAMRVFTAGYVWARLIVDDYDMIKLQWADVLVPSLFTWLISATTRRTGVTRYHVAARPGRSVGEFLWTNMTMPALLATADERFESQVVCLHCDAKYVDAHINSLEPTFRRVVVDAGRAGDILGALDMREDLIEMAEAGAIETASAELGIAVSSLGDLVSRVLQAQVDRYRKAVEVLAALGRTRARRDAEPPGNDPDDPDAPDDPDDPDAPDALLPDAVVLAAVGRGEDPPPGRVAPTEDLERELTKVGAVAKRARTEVGGRLERLRSNLKEGFCQACNVEWDEDEDEDLYIVNCCQIVLCAHCVVRPGNPPTYISRCPHCMAGVDARANLICVGAQLNIGPVLEDGEELFAEEKPGARGGDRYAPWAANARLKTFLQIVEGAKTDAAETDEVVEPFVDGLIGGRSAVPYPADAPNRVLVFAMHAESGDQICAGLGALGIAHARLRGSIAERNRAVAAFKEGRARVLVATSNRDSAGLHLPEATHVVMYHRHRERSVAFQCAGRAQRVGRTHSLEIVEIK